MAVKLCHVAYSASKGVFLAPQLGKPLDWSNDKGLTGEEKAPVFENQADLEDFKKKFLTEEERDQWPGDVELRSVFPYEENAKLVDIEVCSNAMLPRWGGK